MILPFGKHRGKLLCEVPRSYLRWLDAQEWFHDEHPILADDVRRLLGTSENAEPQPHSTALATDVLKSWRRAVLAKWHPDRAGGSHEAFIAVGDAVDSLTRMLSDRGVLA